ncbi:hypothetical protein [Oceaniglobus trochenteri]|uniref:hypothetical protein n=1 Tax=Oceaniglobus trochenteri TaxID=2763260 RepID=UPI001D0002AD|nr:hypothetical protein [Oceaniglobus trochenteri]
MSDEKPDKRELRKMAAGNLLEGGAQLDMFGDEGEVVPVETRSGPGRPAGSGNKLKTKVRAFMAAKGYRDPVEQLAMLAGMDRPDLHPLAYAAQIAEHLGEDVMDVAKVMRQAAADVLPYWHAKVTPDVQLNLPVMNVQMAPPMPGQAAGGRRVGPPPMPGRANDESVANQQVSKSDGEADQ